MTTLKHEVYIHAPVDTVWQVLADLPGVRHYNPLVASSRYVSDQHMGIGAQRYCELKPKGWVQERVWNWDPSRSIGLEVAASEYPIVFMRWKTELRPDGNGTLVTQEMSYKMRFGVLGKLLDVLMMRRMLDRSVVRIFDGLKRYVESRRTRGW